ncbi:hypothetical protein WIS52_14930 [Pseudonocardia nematodicida]|uniref:Uncharacterized protein n=1 Tax=Pseudonocardia nematodicida TaxID=1206997 RepID=A0ABV1KC90_9PSEU
MLDTLVDKVPVLPEVQTEDALSAYAATRDLALTPSLAAIFDSALPDRLAGALLSPTGDGRLTMGWAERVSDSTGTPLHPNLLPLLILDERSFACVVLSSADGPRLPGEGAVVRWHLTLDHTRAADQAAVLDTDCLLYAESVADELEARGPGIERMLNEISPAYRLQYVDAGKRPRDFVLRPTRIACQNVVIAYAAFQHDAAIDGMAVPAWQTCEVPHVAAHEGTRALAAQMLCDTFQSGGTMEIRFDRPASVRAKGTTSTGEVVDVDAKYDGHPEGQVPASLRRYGRTVGVGLGVEDPAAISPTEARELFLAVTPMPDELRQRVDAAVQVGLTTPERLCFTLMMPVWRAIELDFLLATTPRVGSILCGGADWRDRPARQAESELCRAALMAGMLRDRLDHVDSAAAASDVRVFEDDRVGVAWQVSPETAAVRFTGVAAGPVPWQSGRAAPLRLQPGEDLVVVPRTHPTEEDWRTVQQHDAPAGQRAALLVPRDVLQDALARAEAGGLGVLHCPDRLAELDQAIERKLLTARISRA